MKGRMLKPYLSSDVETFKLRWGCDRNQCVEIFTIHLWTFGLISYLPPDLQCFGQAFWLAIAAQDKSVRDLQKCDGKHDLPQANDEAIGGNSENTGEKKFQTGIVFSQPVTNYFMKKIIRSNQMILSRFSSTSGRDPLDKSKDHPLQDRRSISLHVKPNYWKG